VDATAIRNGVLEVIAAVAPGTDTTAIRPDRPLRGQIDLDSMDWLNVLAGLGERFAVSIPDGDAARLDTLDAITAWLAERTSRRAPEGPPATAAVAPLPVVGHSIDGAAVTVRPIAASDLPLEADFLRHLSMESRYERFMVTVGELPAAKLKYLTDVDQVRHVALVATVERDGQEAIVGVARYIVDPNGSGCEFAIAIDDGWHGSGLAGILMQSLIGIARRRGLRTMTGFVLAANTTMLHFARQLGFTARHDPDERDTIRVERTL
jgi:acetyltransferase